MDGTQDIGSQMALPFETRQFVSACRIASAYCILAQIINILGSPKPALLAIIFCLMFLLEGLRWKALRSGLSAELQWAFALSTCLSLALAWIFNGGLHGSIPMVFLLALFLCLSISEHYRQQFLILYVAASSICMTIEVARPDWILGHNNEQIQDVDSALAMFTSMLALGYSTHHFKASYDRQRQRVQSKNEELLASNRKLHEVMKKNHESLHIIAHDLRNPIGAVIGLVEVCREEYQLEEGISKDLATMEEAAQQALALVQQLSEIAYLEERRVVLQSSQVQLEPILERTLRKLEPHARKKQQTLQLSAPTPLQCYVDTGRVASILDNLVENAVKYSPLQGHIDVVAERKEKWAVIRVRDQGPGIPDEQRGKLFTMFGKVGTRPTGKESSTGLGLYISRMLAELHGGRLEQENLNPGSEFRLLLPLS